MTGLIKNRERTELLAGIITLAAALVVLVIAIIILTKCTADPPETTGQTEPSQNATQSAAGLLPNPYSAGDFRYQGGYLTCTAGESMLGIDVSSHQGSIDWVRVGKTSVEFAMVRLGYRGYGDGTLCEDSNWKTNLQGARDNGLKVGVYIFSQAITVKEAQEEAQMVLSLLDGMPLDMPVVFDWETVSDSARTANMTADKLLECALAFCREIEQAGYQPMVYFNIDLAVRLLDLLPLQQAGYKLWLAVYTDQMTYPHRVDMWQYTDGGRVSGIEGNVDLNLYFTYE